MTVAWMPARPPALPVEERDYVSFYRAPAWRWWKPLAAIALVTVILVAVAVLITTVGVLLDGPDGMVGEDGSVRVGPWTFLANNVVLALAIPAVWLTQRVVFRLRPRWASSVEGGLRWGWLARVVAIALPLWLAVTLGSFLVAPLTDASWRSYSLLMIVGILLTTPLQAAGEEFLFRGLLARAVGSWFPQPVVAFGAGAVMSTLVFTLLHGAGDPWLNLYYACFGLAASWLTWRTGGLEAAIAVHAVNNVLGEVALPFTDFSGLFDRGAGAGDPSVLINVALLLVVIVLVEVLARRRRLVVRAAPGRPLEPPQAPWWIGSPPPTQPWAGPGLPPGT